MARPIAVCAPTRPRPSQVSPQAHVVLQQRQSQPAAAAAPGADAPSVHPRTALHARIAARLPTLHQLPAAAGAVRSQRAHRQPHRPCAPGTPVIRRSCERIPTRRLAAAPAHSAGAASPAAEPRDAGRLLGVGLRRRDGAVWDAARPERGRGRAGLRAEEGAPHALALYVSRRADRVRVTSVRAAGRAHTHHRREAPLQGLKLVRCQETRARALPMAAQALGAEDVSHGERPGRMAASARRHQLARPLHPSYVSRLHAYTSTELRPQSWRLSPTSFSLHCTRA